MGMSINTNLSSLNAQRALASSQGSLQTSMQRLSSGLRINSAKDDASGSAIAERMNAQVKGMNQAMRNANDGVSMLQTVDGALSKVTDTLQRMRELAVQGANGTNSTGDYTNLNDEFAQLQSELTRVFDSTKFNGQQLLKGTAGAAGNGVVTFQVGANNATEDQIDVTIEDLSAGYTPLGTTAIADVQNAGTINVSDQTFSQAAITSLDTALDEMTAARSNIGAIQGRFDAVISNLQVSAENATSARSRIMDADFAVETANLSRSQVLQQAGTAMLAQANQSSQNVMQLLR